MLGQIPLGTGRAPDAPPLVPVQAKPQARILRRSAPVPGLGPRLAARIREGGPDRRYRFVARGLAEDDVRAHGGVVTARIGPIISGRLSGHGLRALAPRAELVEAPQPLHPLLDKSRVDIRADEPDRGDGFTSRHRGAGVIIAAYDSGIDLSHPDLRQLDGPSRVVALWDQDLVGTPPVGKVDGHLCTKDVLMRDACPSRDVTGHGTHVMSVAASGGPEYRGIAPEAEIAMARSSTYALFLDSLSWFETVAAEEEKPLVVNVSLGGHEGPHDGTSLEAQAIDALDHLVVAAAGNDGLLPVHAMHRFEGEEAVIALRFPVLPADQDRRAIVEIWGDVGLPLSTQAAVMTPGGETLTETPTVAIGSPGMTVRLLTGTATLGEALLDPEADFNAFNGQPHIRLELSLFDWADAPGGPGYAVVRIVAEGRVDLWVDTPPTEPAPVRFDREMVLDLDNQVLGDADHTISDPATAVSAIAVAAYTTRTEFVNEAGNPSTVGGTIGDIASFTSWGPTISPATTGPKPDLAAPGHVVIGARSQDAPEDEATSVSPLYRAGAGTSLAAPHVAGVAALLLDANPELDKEELKRLILGSAVRDEQVEGSLDPRWGAGRVDAAAALATVAEVEEGCGCRAPGRGSLSDIWVDGGLLLVFGWLWRQRRRKRHLS